MMVDPRFVAWCSACEWNADHDQASKQTLVARLAARQADWLARRLYADVRAHPEAKRRGLVVLGLAYLLTGAVHLITIALVAGGVLAFTTSIVWPLKVVLVAFLLGLAWVVQPFHRRRGRRTTPQLDPATAPALFSLIDDVAAAIEAPTVRTVVVLPDFNAYYFLVSRRKPAISIGMALWAVLEPRERVALLGHQLGHRANGDLRETLLFGAALGSLRRWQQVLLPSPTARYWRAPSLDVLVETFVVPLVLLLFGAVIGTFGDALYLLAQRQGQRCEYYADELAARAAGSAAAIGLVDKLLIGDVCWQAVIQTLKFRAKTDPWQAAREFALSIPPSEWDRRRLLGRRRLNRIDASHPPSMFRGDLLRSGPDRSALVTLTADRSAAIDAELAAVGAAVLAHVR